MNIKNLARQVAVTYAVGLSVVAVGAAACAAASAIRTAAIPAASQYFQMAAPSPNYPEHFCNGRTAEGKTVHYYTDGKGSGELLISMQGMRNGVIGYMFTDSDNNLAVSNGDTIQANYDNGSRPKIRVTAANLEELASEFNPLIRSTIDEIAQLKKEKPEQCGYAQTVVQQL